ncbi:hypothetical protein Ahy_B07g087457 [Arachis hypogaea]|uniref:Uncharacterized protein n=1 Tax=Arachis hypogaea TaxID=3818 RepID=A0A444YC67_ARAHY|nr:hypothetical protein Ahy_B07g087457 [Arachis hypogaea]
MKKGVKRFNPCTVVRHVTNAIKSKFSEFCPAWEHASEQMRNLWFTKFKEKATGVKPSLEEVYTKCHTKKDKSWIDERSEKVIGDVEASKEGLDIPDNYTIWNEIVTKEKKKATFGLGSFGLDLSSKLDSRNYSETSKDNLNLEQELHMWKEKAKELEIINEEQKVKLNDAEHKLKDQGRQLKAQQKRIGSTEKTLHTLYKKLNLPLSSTLSVLADDELGTGSSDDEDDNMSD